MDPSKIIFVKFGRKGNDIYALDDKKVVWKKTGIDEWESVVKEGEPQHIKKGLDTSQLLELMHVRGSFF